MSNNWTVFREEELCVAYLWISKVCKIFFDPFFRWHIFRLHAGNQLVLDILGFHVFCEQIDTFLSFYFKFKLRNFRRWNLWRSCLVTGGKKLRTLVFCSPVFNKLVDATISLRRVIDWLEKPWRFLSRPLNWKILNFVLIKWAKQSLLHLLFLLWIWINIWAIFKFFKAICSCATHLQRF